MPKPLLIEWRTDYLRPVAVMKKNVGAGLVPARSIKGNHKGHPYAHTIHMNIKQRTGEVQCGA